jgi:hypothetical protein
MRFGCWENLTQKSRTRRHMGMAFSFSFSSQGRWTRTFPLLFCHGAALSLSLSCYTWDEIMRASVMPACLDEENRVGLFLANHSPFHWFSFPRSGVVVYPGTGWWAGHVLNDLVPFFYMNDLLLGTWDGGRVFFLLVSNLTRSRDSGSLCERDLFSSEG